MYKCEHVFLQKKKNYVHTENIHAVELIFSAKNKIRPVYIFICGTKCYLTLSKPNIISHLISQPTKYDI
jgi:hypothetical protein